MSKILLGIVGIPLAITVSSLMKGWVLTILWRWFVVPVFELPELTLVPAIGIGMVISYLTHQHDNRKEDEDDPASARIWRSVVYSILNPLIFLLLGWVVHLFL